MATWKKTNSKIENILLVKMRDGKIDSISRESRSVYYNTKGRYIKTVSDGVQYLGDGGLGPAKNIVIISTRRFPYQRGDGNIGHRWEYVSEDSHDLPKFVDNMLKDFM